MREQLSLGVEFGPDMPDGSVLIENVDKGGAMALAGGLPGDLCVRIDGAPASGALHEFECGARPKERDGSLTFEVERDGRMFVLRPFWCLVAGADIEGTTPDAFRPRPRTDAVQAINLGCPEEPKVTPDLAPSVFSFDLEEAVADSYGMPTPDGSASSSLTMTDRLRFDLGKPPVYPVDGSGPPRTMQAFREWEHTRPRDENRCAAGPYNIWDRPP